MLDEAKRALNLTITAYDTELSGYIDAGLLDLSVTAGVTAAEAGTDDPLVRRAVVTYTCAQFYLTRDSERYKLLMDSYDAQKGALRIADGYTDWEARA